MPSANQQGTGFINLQNYLNANQGNQLGSTVAGGITGAANQAQQGLTQSQNSFKQGIQAASQSLVNEGQVATNLFGTTDASGNTTGGLYNTNPSAITAATTTGSNGTSNNPYQSQWQGIENYAYQGPTQLSNLAGTQAQATNAAGLGQLAKSQPGQTELLQQFAASPGQQYSTGEQNLDTMLLGQQGGTQLKQAAQQTAGLPQQVNNAEAAATSQAQGQQQQAQQFVNQQNANFANTQAQLLGGNVNGQTVTGAIPAAQQAAQAQYGAQNSALSAAQAALSKGDLSTASTQLAAAGYSPQQIQQLTQLASIGIWNYNNTGDLAAVANALQAGTAGTGITGQQAAQANALAALGGTTAPNYTASQNTGNGIMANPNVGVLGGDLTKDIAGTNAALANVNAQINNNGTPYQQALYSLFGNGTGGLDQEMIQQISNPNLNDAQRNAIESQYAASIPNPGNNPTIFNNPTQLAQEQAAINTPLDQQQTYQATLAQQQAAQQALNQFISQYQ